ncbi:MAG: MMPL family transporter [Candidatus Eremiobacteraeota bacterium]|nr:MMPL family transporter [Candidatus Eremiobacteraeota bacterium]
MIERLLVGLTRAVHAAPRAALLVVALLTGVAGCLAVGHLSFSSDRTNLLRADHPVQALFRDFRQEFDESQDLVILLQGGGQAQREEAIDRLEQLLKARPELFHKVLGRVELPQIQQRGLYFLSNDKLDHLAHELSGARPFLSALSNQGLAGMLAHLEKPHDLQDSLPLLNGILEQLAESFESRGRSPYRSPFEHPKPRRVFYFTLPSTHLLLFQTDDPLAAAKASHELITRVCSGTQIQGSLTGESLLRAEDARTTTRDAIRSAILSVICCNLLFTFAFGEFRRPNLAILSLLAGITISVGVASLSVEHLNLITVNFVSILVGLGIDFGVHILYRYEEERQKLDTLPALETTMATSGVENFTGAMATAVAFFALLPTSFRAVGELGLIAGLGVLICFATIIVALPALLTLGERKGHLKAPSFHWSNLARAEGWLAEQPGLVHKLCLVVTALALVWLPQVSFDYNLLNMQSPDSTSARVERQLEWCSLRAVAVADNLDELYDLRERFERLPGVLSTSSLAPFLPRHEEGKQERVEAVVAVAQTLPLPRPANTSLESLEALFKKARAGLRRNLDQLPPSPEVERSRQLLERIEKAVKPMGPGPIQDSIEAFEGHLLSDLRDSLEGLKAQTAAGPLTLDELPVDLRERYLGHSGRLLLRIQPRYDLWQREHLEDFLQQLHQVDPGVTGSPVLIYHYLEALRTAYEEAGRNALIVICALLLLHFRSLRLAALALFPKLVGVVWMLGAMGLCGVRFNAANCMALPLTLGIGLVFGVHVVHRMLEEGGSLFAHSTGPAVALSAISTVLGFGTLMTADNVGIATLGFVMATGVSANLMAAVVWLPALVKSFPGLLGDRH